MDEMQGEGVSPARVAALDVSDHSAHWARTQRFLGIVAPLFGDGAAPTPRPQAHGGRGAGGALGAGATADPVIVAGSTGSRGATALLMQAVAACRRGRWCCRALTLTCPPPSGTAMGDALTAEDHPQYRFAPVAGHRLGLRPAMCGAGSMTRPPAPRATAGVAGTAARARDRPVAGRRSPPARYARGHRRADADRGAFPRAEALAIALILREAADGPAAPRWSPPTAG
jgi:ATP-dependent helicase/nuclease subunit B